MEGQAFKYQKRQFSKNRNHLSVIDSSTYLMKGEMKNSITLLIPVLIYKSSLSVASGSYRLWLAIHNLKVRDKKGRGEPALELTSKNFLDVS
jgi:hypothetical protein